jgi:hypothetical protein
VPEAELGHNDLTEWAHDNHIEANGPAYLRLGKPPPFTEDTIFPRNTIGGASPQKNYIGHYARVENGVQVALAGASGADADVDDAYDLDLQRTGDIRLKAGGTITIGTNEFAPIQFYASKPGVVGMTLYEAIAREV